MLTSMNLNLIIYSHSNCNVFVNQDIDKQKQNRRNNSEDVTHITVFIRCEFQFFDV